MIATLEYVGTGTGNPIKSHEERMAKLEKDPHYIALQKAEHIIEWIEGKVRKYAWGFDKKQGVYRYYSKKEFKELQEAGKACTDF